MDSSQLPTFTSEASSHAPAKQSFLANRFADYAHGLTYGDIPENVLHEAKRRIIDSLGCAMGALDDEPARIARTLAKTVSTAERGATVLGTGHASSPDLAAFANGILFRYLDYNDTYLSKEPAHPSDNISAALAVGEAMARSGKDILTAIVLGYEIQCRLCDAASIRARGWDHVTYGSFSTALLAGKLYGLDTTRLIHAQALAATPNNAMRQTRVGELSHWKGCAFANAARNGVFAAQLANLGMTGPSEIFEGEMGFWKQISGPFAVTEMAGEKLAGTTGRGHDDFMMMMTYIKHFPAEYHSQSAIEAALELRPQLQNNISNVQSILIESFDAAVDIIAGFAEHWRPRSRETADHSMPYVVAAALMDGDITLDTFTDKRIHDPALLDLIQKVKVERNAEMNAGYPDGIPNRLIITMTDGRVFSHKIAYPLGHYKNPMGDADIERKFLSLAERVMPRNQAQRILETFWRFETLPDVREALSLFNLER